MSYSDLEVSFRARDERSFELELRFAGADSRGSTDRGPYPVSFDWDVLDDPDLRSSPDDYGERLSGMLFADRRIAEAFTGALAASQRAEGLRVRLRLPLTAPRLHEVFWETLRDPTSTDPKSRLATSDRVILSRFLSSEDMRSVYLRPRANLRALVVIAAPTDLAKRSGLPAIDAEAEWKRAQANLVAMPVKRLSGGGKASLKSIDQTLQADEDRGGFDILYLVCHGSLARERAPGTGPEPGPESVLWLENEAGATAPVKGGELVRLLREIRCGPRLVVLASCQSAGGGEETLPDDKGALAAIGPKLAEAGIPAVLAMQGKIRMDSAAQFFATFFRELTKDGQIDRGVAVARRQLAYSHDDWWVPVLISRLKEVGVWEEHAVGKEDEFQSWPFLVKEVKAGTCTPILGPNLAAPILGSQPELARDWAKRYSFPMAESERDSLPQVAQFLEHTGGHQFLHRELSSYVWDKLVRDFGDRFPEFATGTGTDGARLSAFMREAGKLLREREEMDPYWALARMPFSVYVTTNRHDLIYDALCDAPVSADPRDTRRKNPRKEVCRWAVFQDSLQMKGPDGEPLWPESVFAEDPSYVPSVSEPLVFHAFGHMDYPETLVLTEDDYFDYLIGIMKNRPATQDKDTAGRGTMPIPRPVLDALSLGGLLFLGFRLSDWEFRTLFRHILAQEMNTLREAGAARHANVSVQLAPAEGEVIAARGAREYLQKYLTKGYKIEIAWGTVETFVQRLYEVWHASTRSQAGKGSG